MPAEWKYRGRVVTAEDIAFIRQFIAQYPDASRRRLSAKLCEAWQWKQANGALCDMVCRGLLLMLHRAGEIELPPVRQVSRNPFVERERPAPVLLDTSPILGPLSGLQPIELEQVRRTGDEPLFNSWDLLSGGQLGSAGTYHRTRQERSYEQAEPSHQGNPRFAAGAAFPSVPESVMKQSWPRIDVDLAELDQIIDEGLRAPLSASNGQKLKNALHALVERAAPCWRTTEKTRVVSPSAETGPEKSPPASNKPAPAGHGRNSAARFPGAHRVVMAHPTLRHGDPCPECGAGKVYRQKQPKTLIRIVGRPPLEATRYEMERLGCNGCNQVFTAETPPEAGPEKYDATAAAMIAQLRYGSGVPFKRLERLEGNLGIPLPAATQWGLIERKAERLRPTLQELIRQAAQGEVAHNDDTGMRILKLAREPAPEGRPERTGTFTSGIVSRVGPRFIALFFSGWKHAGENLAEVLKRRAPDLQPLIQMCDALSRNAPKLSEGVRLLLAKKTPVCGSGGELPGRMPVCAGDARQRLLQRRTGPPGEPVMGRPAAFPSGAQRAADEDAPTVDGGATGGAQDRAELGLGKSHPVHAAPLGAADAVPARIGRPPGQQSRRESSEKGDLAPEKLPVLQDDEGS